MSLRNRMDADLGWSVVVAVAGERVVLRLRLESRS